MSSNLSLRRRRRVTSVNSNDLSLPFSLSPSRSIVEPFSSPLTEVEDRRNWNPDGILSPARSISKPRHRLKVADRKYNNDVFSNLRNVSQTKGVITFQAPQKVAICIRRKIRKEVLFATNKGGKVGQRRPKRNSYSSISCR